METQQGQDKLQNVITLTDLGHVRYLASLRIARQIIREVLN